MYLFICYVLGAAISICSRNAYIWSNRLHANNTLIRAINEKEDFIGADHEVSNIFEVF